MILSSLLLTAVASLATVPHTAAESAERTYYSIKIQDRLVGYATSVFSQATVEGRPVRRLESTTALKVSLLGSTRLMTRTATTEWDSNSGELLSYRLVTRANDDQQVLRVVVAGSVARFWQPAPSEDQAGPPPTDAARVTLPEQVLILGGNDFGHWSRLAQRLVEHQGQTPVTLTVLVPDAQSVDTLKFVPAEPTERVVLDKTRQCRVWTTSDDAVC